MLSASSGKDVELENGQDVTVLVKVLGCGLRQPW